MRARYLNERQLQSVVRDWDLGLTIGKIAKRLRIDRTTLQSKLRAAGITLRWPRPAEWRFWRFVEKLSEEDVCWPWKGHCDKDGYGTLSVNGYPVRAHRFSYELHNGLINDSSWVLHKCDNTQCVNPAHLYCGTPTDNNRDTVERGHNPNRKGENHPCSKLTDQDVLTIRVLAVQGIPLIKIATVFQVGEPTISAIVTGQRWQHLPVFEMPGRFVEISILACEICKKTFVRKASQSRSRNCRYCSNACRFDAMRIRNKVAAA